MLPCNTEFLDNFFPLIYWPTNFGSFLFLHCFPSLLIKLALVFKKISHRNTFSPFLTEYFLYSYLFFFTFFLYFFPTFLPTCILIFIKFVEGIANLKWLTLEMKVYQIGSIHIFFFFYHTLSKKYILCLWYIFHRHKCTNEANKSWNNSALATLNIYCVLFYYIFFVYFI